MDQLTNFQVPRQYWWIPLIWGILAVLFGLAAFLWPGITVFTLVYLFGIFILADGVMAVVTSFQERQSSSHWWVLLVAGLIGVLWGIAILVWPHITAVVLLYLIAIW